MTPRGDEPQVRPADKCWACEGWGYDRSTPEKRECPVCKGKGTQRPADTDALIERLHNLLVKELDGGGIDDLHRIADALTREREAGKNLKRAYWNERAGHDTTRERAERAEAQVEALNEGIRWCLDNWGLTGYVYEKLEALASLPPQEQLK